MANEALSRFFFLVFLITALFLGPGKGQCGETLDFVVIHPGQPGTEAEAQPILDALGDALKGRLNLEIPVRGKYFNDLDKALAFLESHQPAWGIVGLGFFSAWAKRFSMTAIAATRPGGAQKDVWRLLVAKDGPDAWQQVQGQVFGNMLFDRLSAACLLFKRPLSSLPFSLEGTSQPLRSLQAVARGAEAGVVVDSRQFEAIQALPLRGDLKVIHTSPELPTSPVVWFGPPDDLSSRLAKALQDMVEDPDAAILLRNLQTQGFGPSDRDLPGLVLGEHHEKCFD